MERAKAPYEAHLFNPGVSTLLHSHPRIVQRSTSVLTSSQAQQWRCEKKAPRRPSSKSTQFPAENPCMFHRGPNSGPNPYLKICRPTQQWSCEKKSPQANSAPVQIVPPLTQNRRREINSPGPQFRYTSVLADSLTYPAVEVREEDAQAYFVLVQAVTPLPTPPQRKRKKKR